MKRERKGAAGHVAAVIHGVMDVVDGIEGISEGDEEVKAFVQ
jgi:hypothetical protein